MHAAFFSLKRAFHSTLTFSRPILARYGLTPARFDLLLVVYIASTWTPAQCEIAETLDVTAATVSRMVSSLEKLGLVSRRLKPRFGRHYRFVGLTDEGRARVLRVIEEIIDSGDARFAAQRAFVARWWSRRSRAADGKRLATFLLRIRDAFDDKARLDMAWHLVEREPRARRRAVYVYVAPGDRAPPSPTGDELSSDQRRAVDAWN